MKDPFTGSVLRIVLVRHGETEWNRAQRFQGQCDEDLNEKGRAQAEALALTLKEEPLQAIYSSPISRAIETAKAINRYHQAPIQQRDGLMEMNLGEFDGLYPQDLMDKQPGFLKKWFEDPATVRMPNGESLAEVQARAWLVVEEIVNTFPEGSILICGHNFVNMMILCKILGMDITHFRRLRQSLGALNIIERSRGLFSLVRFNDTCHLKGMDPPS